MESEIIVDEKNDFDEFGGIPRQTRAILSKYEKTRILGARATLIAKGAQPYVNTDGETDPIEIARMELNAKMLPIIVRRYLPNGKYEDWRLQDFK